MEKKTFSRYEIFIIAILTFLQFTIILDFMVLSPLGVILLKELKITTSQFGAVVSAYAFTAGASGLLAAGFADKFDRKKLLLFFYTGFVIGTLLCGIADTYEFLLIARIVTGLFGGVIGSIAFAIVTDLFKLEVRGRVMGFLGMAFAGAQVLGLPIGFYLANKLNWHVPFMMIVIVSMIVGVLIVLYMKPIDAHLHIPREGNVVTHLYRTLVNKNYLRGFGATVLLATGGFMLMPFGSAFTVNNLGIEQDNLTMIYLITGIFSMGAGPLIGKLADSIGKFKVFVLGTALTIVIVLIYTQLGVTPLWAVILISVIMFVGVSSRMISSSALLTAVPEPKDRGAFMGINSSIQQISGGIATFIAGIIVIQSPGGKLERYDLLGYVVTGSMIITVTMMYVLNRYVQRKLASQKAMSQASV